MESWMKSLSSGLLTSRPSNVLPRFPAQSGPLIRPRLTPGCRPSRAAHMACSSHYLHLVTTLSHLGLGDPRRSSLARSSCSAPLMCSAVDIHLWLTL